jgi:hypothetical protein
MVGEPLKVFVHVKGEQSVAGVDGLEEQPKSCSTRVPDDEVGL